MMLRRLWDRSPLFIVDHFYALGYVMKKLVFISDIATPQQVKFCNELQKEIKATFLFYEYPNRTRGAWWEVNLGENCKVLNPVYFARPGIFEYRYFAPRILEDLRNIDPDIVMLGGFTRPSNYFAYLWARKHHKKTIVFTERSRDSRGKLRKKGLAWSILGWLYRNLDAVMVSDEDIAPQFRDEFGFGDKVIVGRYPADLEAFFSHEVRKRKNSSGYTYLFANRLTDIYNPIFAIELFDEVLRRYPDSILLMNSAGELRADCEKKIENLGIFDSVEFLDSITSWEYLPDIYRRSDILLLPAKFSNGNYTILEAMASGMGIVISQNVMGVGNLIADGSNGFKPELEVDCFMNSINQYIQKPNLFIEHAKINKDIAYPYSTSGVSIHFQETLRRGRFI